MAASFGFNEHNDIIWGTRCACGNDVFVLQNQHHPWDGDGFKINVPCAKCLANVRIDHLKATQFYNAKIHSYFKDIQGTVLDLGCGGGFLSEQLLRYKDVEKVVGLDLDKDANLKLATERFEFICGDIAQLNQLFEPETFDYLVSRDVFMFVKDTEQYFKDVTQLVNKGIYQMGWSIHNHPRMQNNLSPDAIVECYKRFGWQAEIEYLDWYKSGYFIKAIKR